MNAVNDRGGKIVDEDIQDMNLSGNLEETEKMINLFKQIIRDEEKRYESLGQEVDYYSILKKGCLAVIWN